MLSLSLLDVVWQAGILCLSVSDSFHDSVVTLYSGIHLIINLAQFQQLVWQVDVLSSEEKLGVAEHVE